MGQSIEEVLNRLVAVEDAAQQMQDAVDAQKKELAAQMEEKKKQFDSMLEFLFLCIHRHILFALILSLPVIFCMLLPE